MGELFIEMLALMIEKVVAKYEGKRNLGVCRCILHVYDYMYLQKL